MGDVLGALAVGLILAASAWQSNHASARDGVTPALYDAPECSNGKGTAEGPPTADMYGTSEIVPAGALRENGQPMSWAIHPRMTYGSEPPAGWSAIVPWGQVFISQLGDASHNTRVEVRNLRLFIRLKLTRRWCRLLNVPTPSGALYVTNFAGDSHIPGDQRIERDGGRSFRAVQGRAIHFYSTTRVGIPKGGLSGVYADFEARLIKDDLAGPDDRDQASLVASAGADYWVNDTAPPGHNGTFNDDAGIGRFRRVTTTWQSYGMNTAAPGAIKKPTQAVPALAPVSVPQ